MKKKSNNRKSNKSTNTRHDGFIKRVLGDPIIAREFIEEYLPYHIQEKLDLSTLNVEKESFVSKSLKKQLSDMIYSVKLKDNRQGLIYCLIEHQSSPDYWIAFRLWEYMLLLLETYKKDKEKLPIIIPLVLYNGKKKYNAPRNLWELFSDPIMAKNLMCEDYNLVDLESMADDQINYNKALSLISYVMKHIHERDTLLMIENAMRNCKRAIIIDKEKNYIHLKHIIWYIDSKVAEDKKKDLDELINKNLPEENNEEFMRTIAQSYIDEGIQKGIIQGIEKGKEEGREEGIEKGIEKTKTETAMKMLKFGSEISFIKDVTGLAEQEILKIKANL